MKVIGITSGIGSMLVGAKQLGFEVLGNIEWRRYYHAEDEHGRNTFREHFNAPMYKNIDEMTLEEIDKMTGADIAFGHPECGNFSNMSATAQQTRTLTEMRKDAGDIPIFTDLVSKLKPRFFVQDNIPKSLIGFGIEKCAAALPEYDLFPEWVSHWGYGNIQKFRKRFFMIGALKSEHFVFRPWEIDTDKKLSDILVGIDEEDDPNQNKHTEVGNMSKGKGIFGPDPMTWAQYKEFMLREKDGVTITYIAKDGTWKTHVGWRKAFKDGYVPVITGGCPIANPFTGLPFTVRERCRIQGLPDDFQIYGTKFQDDGTWNHSRNSAVIKQTGKCMPVEFCKYVTEQIKGHIDGDAFYNEGPKRILNHNPLIDEAKQWYCNNVGYEHQEAVCKQCWVKPCQKTLIKDNE
jgi:site-specific DNA-cytosine methylase